MKNLYLTTALALIASPALADITPEDLWQSWQDTTSQFGMGLTAGSQNREGAVLVLQDVKTTMDFGFFQFEQVFGEMRLEALENGAVSVSYNTDISGTATMDIPDSPSPDITLSGLIEGTQGVVTGTVDDYTYDFSIGTMQISGITDMGDESGTQSQSTSTSISTGLSGRIHFVQADAGMNIAYTFSLDRMNNTQDTTNSFGGGESNFKQSQTTLAEGYSGAISLFVPNAQPDSANGSFIPEGLTMEAELAIAHMNVTQKTASPYFNMEIELDQQDSGGALSIDGQHIAVSADGKATYINVGLPALGPEPYHTEFAHTDFALSLPYRPSDTPQDAHIALGFGGVTVSDNIWAEVDPENTLSRTPADFAIAADFSTTLLLDWTNIEAVKAWDSAPALLHKSTLQRFLVAFENAKIEGEGAVEYSNENDVPEPNGGALSFTLSGIPALLDTLGGLPFVDPEIISQAHGMLGVFTRASEGDALVSDIEFGEGGSVSINGQRVK